MLPGKAITQRKESIEAGNILCRSCVFIAVTLGLARLKDSDVDNKGGLRLVTDRDS